MKNEEGRGWPGDVKRIGLEDLDRLGIRQKDNKLFWDGKELVTRGEVHLRWFELSLLTLVAVGTFGSFILNLGADICGWGN